MYKRQVLIELRARFDEQNNIDWSERLEEAGCRVLYGFDGYKAVSYTHLIRQMKEANKKKEEKIKELQDFISRFSANA